MQLIYLSPVPWRSFSQRPHKFVEWFHAKQGETAVLWVDPYPTRFPLLSDFSRLGAPERSARQHLPSWLQVLRPRALPIEPLPCSGWLHALHWHSLLKEIIAFAGQNSTLLGIGKPSVLALTILKRLSGITSFYDAMDDFPAFYSALSRIAMQCRERQLVGNVTHVLASSTALLHRLAQMRPDVQLIPNGLDSSALQKPITSDIKDRRLIFGYVGTIGPWFDWEWIIALAEIRPNDLVRIIGPTFVSVPHKSLPDNIELLPSCDHENAIRAMGCFDIGIIPFRKNDLTQSVDPIKYYEYRALGLPVISTDFGEMTLRGESDGTFLSRGAGDIAQRVQAALNHKSDVETIGNFIHQNTWEARFSCAKIL